MLILAVVVSAACDRADSTVTAPAAAQAATQSSLAIEPATPRLETLPGESCSGSFPLGTRFGVIVRGTDDLILRRLSFQFADRLGAVAFPEVIPVPSLIATVPAPTIPTSSPIPFPGSLTFPAASVIPMPGSLPIQGILVARGASRTFPLFLRLGCVARGDGTLLIRADIADTSGTLTHPELRVRVGG